MRLHGILLALAFSGSLSCGDTVTGPLHEDVRLAVVPSPSSGSAGNPVTLRRAVRNAGQTFIRVEESACLHHIFVVYDAAGHRLQLNDPRVIGLCALDAYSVPPGETVERVLMFDGRYYSPAGDLIDVPPGAYRAVASVTYVRDPKSRNREWVTVHSETGFTWQ